MNSCTANKVAVFYNYIAICHCWKCAVNIFTLSCRQKLEVSNRMKMQKIPFAPVLWQYWLEDSKGIWHSIIPPPKKNSLLRILANLSKSWKPTECITQGVTDCFSNIVQLTVRYLLFPVQAYCNWFPKFTFQSINYTSSCNYKLRPITRQMDSQTYTGPWLASAAECLSISWHCWLGDREGREPMRIYSSYPPQDSRFGRGSPTWKSISPWSKMEISISTYMWPLKICVFPFLPLSNSKMVT